MSNIIHLNKEPDDPFEKELERARLARPFVRNSLEELLAITSKVLAEHRYSPCCIHDLIYSGCIHLAFLFSQVPEHPFHYKMIEQIRDPLLYNARECSRLQEEWEQDRITPIETAACNERIRGEMNKRYFEIQDFLEKQPLLLEQCHCDDEALLGLEEKFNHIEFILRNEFKELIKRQLAELKLIFERDSILFILLDNTTRVGVLASVCAKKMNIELEEFMQPGLVKLTKIAKNASDL